MNQDESHQRSWPDPEELKALGGVIQAASNFEHTLGQTFCALVGSKYAAVLVGNKTSAQLIEDCRSLTKAQRELEESAKAAIVTVLNQCAEANRNRNRLVHDMWAAGPGGGSHLLRREKSGYDLQSRLITVQEIDVTAGELTRSAVQLNSVILNNLGPERSTLEAQLRWEDALAQMTPGEKIGLLWRRLAGMLGEMSRLFRRYNQQEWADWAAEAAESVTSNPDQVMQIIKSAYDQGGLFSILLSGEPTDPGPTWLKGQDPNLQLATLREQIGQLTGHLLSLSENGDVAPPE